MLSKYPDEYWMQHDLDHEFPWDFYNAMAAAGWMGICIPEEYGGGGAGVQEAALLLEEVTGNGGALNAGTQCRWRCSASSRWSSTAPRSSVRGSCARRPRANCRCPSG